MESLAWRLCVYTLTWLAILGDADDLLQASRYKRDGSFLVPPHIWHVETAACRWMIHQRPNVFRRLEADLRTESAFVGANHSLSWGDALDACWSSSSFVSRALCLGIASFRGAAFALSAFHSWREREKAQERKLAVLVTGSSSGIGLQVTRLLLALDFYVIGTRLHSEDPRRVFEEICRGSTRTPEGGAEPRPAAAGERPRREETEEREDERERERKEDSRVESGESGETIGQTKQDGAEHRRRWRGSRTQRRRPAEAREGADRERGDAGVTENRDQESVQTECGVGDEANSRLLLLPMDVTNAEDVARAVEATKKFLRENDVSGLYALVNCAGIWNWNFIQTQSPQVRTAQKKLFAFLFAFISRCVYSQ
ncbi:oxidoreductase, short chain dehydrogenase/reductase family protein [Toxoplasma gondii CAST]|uniref:Oxidoreductase, short chain dehydrogenase/reductase family protein n=1 Tax=Toxoplasma gondii CAST TaxID=943122 RepID=A0A3R7Z317_TOXGO|nr:oxidoreductase, short chain dehydrogenase/reductase family protein [Toxoplasma gondii CAST]